MRGREPHCYGHYLQSACSACCCGVGLTTFAYVWVQFFPCLALPLLFLTSPPKYTGTFYWIIAAALYALAKLFEYFDSAIYSTGSLLSGHTLKHFAAAAASFAVLRYFQTRRR